MGNERVIMSTLVVLMLVLWGGFVVHQAPRFAGSLVGGALAISGAVLMVVFSLAYATVKRIPWFRARVSPRVSLGTLLKWHVYTGAFGSILALLHTGHRFESTLGIALTAAVLVAALSGYVGRVLLAKVSVDLREQRADLARLESAYNEALLETTRDPGPPRPTNGAGIIGTLSVGFFPHVPDRGGSSAYRAVRLAEAIAEREYSIRSYERFKKLASVWLKVHIGSAAAFFVLLGLHVWASIHFGLRWFE